MHLLVVARSHSYAVYVPHNTEAECLVLWVSQKTGGMRSLVSQGLV